MKITRQQLAQIINEERQKLADVATLVKGAIQKKRYSENNKLTLTDLQQIVQEEIVKLNEEK